MQYLVNFGLWHEVILRLKQTIYNINPIILVSFKLSGPNHVSQNKLGQTRTHLGKYREVPTSKRE